MHLSVPECQARVSSSEFVDWMVYLEQQEWDEPSKLDHYLAQIAAEIRVIRLGLSGKKESVSINSCLLKFRPESAGPEPRKDSKPEIQYEIGPELVKDPKWAKINDNAKLAWFAALGFLGGQKRVEPRRPPTGT